METVHLINALDNLRPDSGATDDYCRGLVVGLVSGLMAEGWLFTAIMILIAQNWKPKWRTTAWPESWPKPWETST